MLDFKRFIREIPDYPKKGVSYKDITPLLLEPKIVNHCVDIMLDNIPSNTKIHKVVGIESRGFLLSSILAQRLNAGLVLVRKAGKLPYKTIQKQYDLEYGTDTIEMHVDSIKPDENIIIHDDVLATGGTAKATNELVKESGGIIIQHNFLIELEFLNGRRLLEPEDIFSVMYY
jgi:adenine phosphoribosyltransferase